MNFAKKCSVRRAFKLSACGLICILAVIFLVGCSDNIQLPSDAELAEFHKAGPLTPETDIDRLLQSQGKITEYRISQDDLLRIHLPAALAQTAGVFSQSAETSYQHLTRVDAQGSITLPVVERVAAEGRTLKELEAAIVAAFYPRYTSLRPTIVARVEEYHTSQVAITGAVSNPGVYELPGYKMTLVSAIMAAGGISNTGAAVIRIHQPGDMDNIALAAAQADPNTPPQMDSSRLDLTFSQMDTSGLGIIHVKDGAKLLYAEQVAVTDPTQRQAFIQRLGKAYPDIPTDFVAGRISELAEVIAPGSGDPVQAGADMQIESPQTRLASALASGMPKPLLLPVKGMNIPFADIALQDGASIEVQQIDPQVFTVIGLIKRPGAFPYPPTARYNLLDALGFAGGVDENADPRFLRVYRRTADGRIVDAAFAIRGNLPTSAATMLIKPGDVIAVEQTPRTRANLLMSQIFRIQFGAMSYYRLDSSDDD